MIKIRPSIHALIILMKDDGDAAIDMKPLSRKPTTLSLPTKPQTTLKKNPLLVPPPPKKG